MGKAYPKGRREFFYSCCMGWKGRVLIELPRGLAGVSLRRNSLVDNNCEGASSRLPMSILRLISTEKTKCFHSILLSISPANLRDHVLLNTKYYLNQFIFDKLTRLTILKTRYKTKRKEIIIKLLREFLFIFLTRFGVSFE